MLSRSSAKSDNPPDKPSRNDVCVDASVWVRFLTKESTSRSVDSYFEKWLDEGTFFVAPSLLIFEIVSGLRKKCKSGLLPTTKAKKILEGFYEYPILLYQSEALLDLTFDIAEKLDMMFPYDASYVALAAWKKVPFYTADVALYEKGKELYPDCYLV